MTRGTGQERGRLHTRRTACVGVGKPDAFWRRHAPHSAAWVMATRIQKGRSPSSGVTCVHNLSKRACSIALDGKIACCSYLHSGLVIMHNNMQFARNFVGERPVK